MEDKLIELKKKIRSRLHLDFILPEDLPEMELYMDQVTRYMEQQLGGNRRSEEDKVLTRTMINNYTRNHLMSSPARKKYSRGHIIQLIYIYYLKNVLAINDIRKLLLPLQEKEPLDEKMAEIYQDIYELEKPQYFNIEASTVKAASLVEKKFPAEKDPYLNKMAFIYLLGYDMFSKKRLIEKLIDEMSEEAEKEIEKNAEKKTAHKKTASRAAARKTAGKKRVVKKAQGSALQNKAAQSRTARKPAARKKEISGEAGKRKKNQS